MAGRAGCRSSPNRHPDGTARRQDLGRPYGVGTACRRGNPSRRAAVSQRRRQRRPRGTLHRTDHGARHRPRTDHGPRTTGQGTGQRGTAAPTTTNRPRRGQRTHADHGERLGPRASPARGTPPEHRTADDSADTVQLDSGTPHRDRTSRSQSVARDGAACPAATPLVRPPRGTARQSSHGLPRPHPGGFPGIAPHRP